jgi:hypothetical protein
MSAEAIRIVTLEIESLLKGALRAAGGNNQTTFVGPLDDQSASNAALVLFLCRVTANQSLRNSEHWVSPENPDGPDRRYANSLPLDLHYLLTVGPREQAGEPESLRLLGYALQALNDLPILVGSKVGGETVRLSLDPVSSEEISRVWALFPTVNYRTSVLYLASPVWIDPATSRTEAPGVTNQDVVAGHTA